MTVLLLLLVVIFLIASVFLDDTSVPQTQIYDTNPNIHKLDAGLYITNSHNARDYLYLKRLGIKQILIVGSELQRHGDHLFKVMHIKIYDTPVTNIKKHFNAALDFIKMGPTLVHCYAGVSRSVTICAAYLMRKYNLSAQEAVNRIKSIRSIASPNFGFIKQLEQFEEELKKKQCAADPDNDSDSDSGNESDSDSE